MVPCVICLLLANALANVHAEDPVDQAVLTQAIKNLVSGVSNGARFLSCYALR